MDSQNAITHPHVFERILEFISDPQDYLNIRLVCSSLKECVDRCPDFLNKFKGVTITIDNKSVASFVDNYMKFIPYFHFSIVTNNDPYFYESESVKRFVANYGNNIKQIQVDYFFMCQLDSELEFWNCLENLEILRITRVAGIEAETLGTDEKLLIQQKRNVKGRYPNAFIKLQQLHSSSDIVYMIRLANISLVSSPFLTKLTLPAYVSVLRRVGYRDGIDEVKLRISWKEFFKIIREVITPRNGVHGTLYITCPGIWSAFNRETDGYLRINRDIVVFEFDSSRIRKMVLDSTRETRQKLIEDGMLHQQSLI